MKFNTGLCFVLSGLSLWLHHHYSRLQLKTETYPLTATLTATLVVAISGITFSQYLFNWNAGLDEFFKEADAIDLAEPGRMSAITALTFIFLGFSLLLVCLESIWTLVGQLLALCVTIIASLSLLGFLFQADLTQVQWFSSIALHTAASFWVLSLGIMALRPDQGFMQVYTEDTNSARQGRWFLLSALLVMPLIAELRIIGQRDLELYDTYFGIAILTVASITALTLINWFKTRTGNNADIEIHNLNRVYAVLSGINTLIVRAKNRDELFQEACKIAVKTGHFSWAWIVMVDPDSQKRTLSATEGGNDNLLNTLNSVLDTAPQNTPENITLLSKTIQSRKPLILNNIRSAKQTFKNFPNSYADLLKHGIRSLVMLPLGVEGKVIGVFALHADTSDFFDRQEMNLLLEMAGDISFAIHNLTREKEFNYLAFHDPLTDLANRSHFIEMLGKTIKSAAKANNKLTLVLLDIRRFRAINESLGRIHGDEILRKVADRLYVNVPLPETLARLQSDCFAMFHVSNRQTREQQGLYRRLQDSICEPLAVADQQLSLQIAMGIAIFPDDGGNGELLLNNAEAALKTAKEAGQLFTFYETTINDSVVESFILENKLRTALEKEQFVLHYQPKIDFGQKTFNQVEALIRWQDPEQGLVPPGKFIPLLEQTGLILEVGKWAMQQAIKDIKRWEEMGLEPPRVAVNVSAVQLRDKGFTGTVVNMLTEFGDSTTMLDLELTESLIMENVQRAGITFKTLKTLGVEISIDDFGTGHSSLAYLARLPIDMLKIDRSFIMGMTEADEGIELVGAIISLAHSLKLKAIAEGVETEEQATTLQKLGCDMMQGYLFCKPVPFDELATLLVKENRTK